jgi:ATP-dependent Clp protease, protease subunit
VVNRQMLPGDEGADRPRNGSLADEVKRHLFGRRAVVVTGSLDGGCTADVVAQLMTLDADGDGPIELRLQNVGASYDSALAVMDTIELLGVPVRTLCLGRVRAGAVGVVAVSSSRAASPHAIFELAEPEVGACGDAEGLERWALDHRRQRDRFVTVVARACRRDPQAVSDDFSAGRWLDPDEAAGYGLIDVVAVRDR